MVDVPLSGAGVARRSAACLEESLQAPRPVESSRGSHLTNCSVVQNLVVRDKVWSSSSNKILRKQKKKHVSAVRTWHAAIQSIFFTVTVASVATDSDSTMAPPPLPPLKKNNGVL